MPIGNIKEYQKKYREQNRDHMHELTNAWRLKNNDKMACTCGRKIVQSSFNRHLKTNMHTKYLKKLNDELPVLLPVK